MSRNLYLVAYDVCNPRRLSRVSRYMTGYKTGGQKSVVEVWVTPAEMRHIRSALQDMIAMGEDRLHIVALDPRMIPRCLGNASHAVPTFFSIV